MRFQFIHAADLHLDTPFTGMHRVDARLAATLRDATTQAFDNLVAAALERSVAFVVIAGDVYDGPERGVRAQLAFRDGLDRLARAGIRSFVVHGNHDPVEDGWSAVRTWPDGVTVFRAGEVTTIPVERDGQTLALVHGISYPRRAVSENLALRFRRDPAQCFQVGVLHCNVGASADHAPYSPCSIEDLVASGLDYWALGHVHLRQCLHENGPWINYPGSLQGLSPKPSERGAKGALVTDVDDLRVTRVEFVPLDVVRFDEFEIDIAGVPDVAGLLDALVEAARDRAATHDGRALVLRVSLTGRGAVHRDLRRGHIRDYILHPARTALASATQTVWLDTVDDRTSPEIDIEALRGRGDFAADLVETVDSMLATPAARPELIAAHLDDLPSGDLRRLLGDALDCVPTSDEIRSALEVALDRVTEVE
jgi:DNA repair exonuclease SbcCD nuclease subunit